MSLAKDDEVIKYFLLQALYETFDESHCVGGSKRRLLYFCFRVAQRVVERSAELAVTIVHHDLGFESGCLDVPAKRLGLLEHPGFIRLERGWGDENPARFDMQEHQDESRPLS